MNSRALPWVVLGVAAVGGIVWFTQRQQSVAGAVALSAPPAPPPSSGNALRDIGRMLDPTISGSIGNQAVTGLLTGLLNR